MDSEDIGNISSSQEEHPQELDVMLSSTPNGSTIEFSSSFKKFPILPEVFIEKPYNKETKRSTSSCLFCSEEFKNSDAQRLSLHLKKCKKVPTDLKDRVSEQFDDASSSPARQQKTSWS